MKIIKQTRKSASFYYAFSGLGLLLVTSKLELQTFALTPYFNYSLK